MKQTSAMTFREVDHLPPMRIDSIKKKIVAADMAIEMSQKEYPTKSPDWSIIESPEAASTAWPENRLTTAKHSVKSCFIYLPCIGGLNVSIRFRSYGITTYSHTWFKKNRNELSGLKLRIQNAIDLMGSNAYRYLK